MDRRSPFANREVKKEVFPSARSTERPMSNNAILAALRRIGITKEEDTGHGFRATARTLLDEVLKVRPDIIKHQLAHAVQDPNERAYNRTAISSPLVTVNSQNCFLELTGVVVL